MYNSSLATFGTSLAVCEYNTGSHNRGEDVVEYSLVLPEKKFDAPFAANVAHTRIQLNANQVEYLRLVLGLNDPAYEIENGVVVVKPKLTHGRRKQYTTAREAHFAVLSGLQSDAEMKSVAQQKYAEKYDLNG